MGSLVLTRYSGETITIFDKNDKNICEITVYIVERPGKRTVKICLDADPDYKILRNEIIDRVNKKNE